MSDRWRAAREAGVIEASSPSAARLCAFPAAGLGLPNPATLRDVNGNGHKYRAAEQNHPGNHDFTPNTLGNFDAFDAAAGSTRSGGLIP
jgi:hypothetical protein